jgi:hypothetical protein
VTGGYLWMNSANSVANGGPFGNITPNAPGTDQRAQLAAAVARFS